MSEYITSDGLPILYSYRGKPISECNHQELQDAFVEMYRENQILSLELEQKKHSDMYEIKNVLKDLRTMTNRLSFQAEVLSMDARELHDMKISKSFLQKLKEKLRG